MRRAMLITMLLLSTFIAGCGANAGKVSINNEMNSDRGTQSNTGTQIEQHEENGNWNAFYNEGLGS